MKLNRKILTLLPLITTAYLANAASAPAQQPTPVQQQPQAQPGAPAAHNEKLDVAQLFTTTCGWCHSDGGRAVGKGPQLMDTKRDDDFIRNRIKNGKQGAMPAFGATFNDVQIDQIIKYIRDLKPD
jgi:mono/diheme cytochrome c family protein